MDAESGEPGKDTAVSEEEDTMPQHDKEESKSDWGNDGEEETDKREEEASIGGPLAKGGKGTPTCLQTDF